MRPQGLCLRLLLLLCVAIRPATTRNDTWDESAPRTSTIRISTASHHNDSSELDKSEASVVTVEMPLYGGLLVDTNLPNVSVIASSRSDGGGGGSGGGGGARGRLSKINPAPNGKLFRVATMIEPPFVTYVNHSEEMRRTQRTGPGIVIEILSTMQKLHNFEYEFSFSPDNSWGEPDEKTGNWTGMFGMLQRNEVEMIAAASIIRYDRHAVADYTHPFYAAETGMLIRSPERYVDNRFLIVTAPFRWEVWALTALAVLVSGGIMRALSNALESASEIQYNLWEATWVFFSVFVQQGLPVQPKSWTCRTLLAFWWLAALTLVATFTGNMVALFAVNRSYLPFTTQEEMVYKVRYYGYTVIMTNSSVTRLKFIQNSQQDLYQKLWYEMSVKGKWINVSTYEDGVNLVKARPNMVLLGPKETLHVYAARDCNVTVAPGGLIPVMYSIALKKKSEFSNLFDAEIRDLVEMGFITKWWNDYFYALSTERGTLCSTGDGVTSAGQPIDISRAQGAFWILLAGVILAASGFAIEYVIRLAKRAIGRGTTGAKKDDVEIKTGSSDTRKVSIRGGGAGGDRHDIDSRYHKVYDMYKYASAAPSYESSRSYQPVIGGGGAEPNAELKQRHTTTAAANVTVLKF